jgi:AraC-like DNA-binding protein
VSRVDVLSDVLSRAHARGALFGRWLLSSPWGLDFDDGQMPLSLHTVLSGELTCEREGSAAQARQGDLVLVRGGRYRFVHAPGAAARPVAAVLATGPAPGTPRTYLLGGAGHHTELLCGAYTFDGGLWPALLAGLPEVTVVGSAGDRALSTLLALLAEEIRGTGPGQQTVLDRLLDLLLVAALRVHWSAAGAAAPGWFRAVGDPVAGPALRALHEEPARPWTIADLAERAGVSRATLARRFSSLLGQPPLAYLTGWRMELARDALESTNATIASVARTVGYADEFSFATAFKREVGIAPGRYRSHRAG